MKSVITSIQPYYVFLIIARAMGWDIPQEKTVEVRKDYPKDRAWNKVTHIYCSKNRESFNRIPKQYQPFMAKLLGKVIGEFVCDSIEKFTIGSLRCDDIEQLACLSYKEMIDYFYEPEEIDGKTAKFGYGWHISDLKIYDNPKELGEFKGLCKYPERDCGCCPYFDYTEFDCKERILTRSPQSWQYVEE